MEYSNSSTTKFYSPLELDDDSSTLLNPLSSNTTMLQSESIYDLTDSTSSPTLPLSIKNEHIQTDDDVLFEIDVELDYTMRHLLPLEFTRLKTTKCVVSHLTGVVIYDLMAPSNQIVILDNQLNIRSSIAILMQTNMSISTIWHKEKGCVYDVLSPMSLISALSSRVINDIDPIFPLESLLCDFFPFACHSLLTTISSESTLYNAAQILFNNSLLFLPVVNLINQSICHILSIKDILSVLYSRSNSFKTMPVLGLTLKQLNIVPDRVSVLFPSDSMWKVFQNFCKQTSIVPIVSEEGILVNTFAVIDGIRILAEYPKINLATLSITDALNQIFPDKIRFFTCFIDDPISKVFSIFLKANSFSLIIINESGHPLGLICLLNLLEILFLL